MVGEELLGEIQERAGEHLMDEALKLCRESVPGFVLATSLNNERSIESFGHRQVFGIDQPLTMTVDTHFDLGSITKVVATTASLMTLLSQRAFSLTDKVSKFIPEWDREGKESITVKDLLLHRSGLWEWRPLYIQDQNPQTVHTRIASIPLRYGVNQERHYSDLGFITLGKILSALTDEELVTSVERLVLWPLEMAATSFAHPASSENIAATSWGDSIEREMVRSKSPYPVPETESDFEGWRTAMLSGEVNDGNAFHLFAGASSHAGLFSTASDLLSFGESLLKSLNGEGYFAGDVVELFLKEGPDAHQSLGFRSWRDVYKECSADFFGHTGFPGTVVAVSPKHNFVATLLTNRLHVANSPVPTEDLWRPMLSALHRRIHSDVDKP